MSKNRFVISDTHFGHTNSWQKFKLPNGDPLRPFTSTEEMDEAIISNWNSVVRPQDKVYVLGDVVINRKHMHKIGQLNGTKILIAGNHDVMRTTEYLEYFKEVKGVGVLSDFVLTHIPIHPCSLERWSGGWHGHLHSK